jgi:glycosyltransferase involved in cell wall biosynthesis
MKIEEIIEESEVALLITGRIQNSWKYSADITIKNIINKFNPVIFVSTYRGNDGGSDDLKEFSVKYKIPQNRINIETFVPSNNKCWTNEPNNSNFNDSAAIYRFGSMFFHNYKAFQLMTNYEERTGVVFKYIIKWRADIIPFTPLPRDIFSDISIMVPRDENQYNNSEIIDWNKTYPKNRISAEKQQSLLTVCPDHCLAGPKHLMKQFCNIFNNLERYYEDYGIEIGPNHCPEYTIYNHLLIDNVPWKLTNDTWLYMVKRVYDNSRPDHEKNRIEREREEAFYKRQLLSFSAVKEVEEKEKEKEAVKIVEEKEKELVKIVEEKEKELVKIVEEKEKEKIMEEKELNAVKEKPLLQLIMIVKDAAVSIKECLESYRPYISYWYILDTGSTDDTQEIIKSVLRDIPGELGSGPFVNFAVTRNLAVSLAKKPCIFYIMPDDTYILHGGSKMLSILNNSKNLKENVIGIKVKGIDCDYNRSLIVKTEAELRYDGDIHADLMASIVASITDDDIFIVDKFYPSMHKRSKERWLKDIDNLLGHHLADPTNTRTMFYLAMTYYAVERINESIEMFKKRISAKDTYYEERFIACVNLGLLTSFPINIGYFQQAMQEYPKRIAECFFHMAVEYEKEVKRANEMGAKEVSGEVMSANDREILINSYEKLIHFYIKEASRYDPPTKDSVLFLDTKIYYKQIPMMCCIYSIKNNDNNYAYIQIQKLKSALQLYNKLENEMGMNGASMNGASTSSASMNGARKDSDSVEISKFIEEINIDSLIALSKKNNSAALKRSNKKVVVFVTGPYWHSWNGDTCLKKGSKTGSLGGSEEMLRIYAEYIAGKNGYKEYEVYAFVHCDPCDQLTIRGVNYKSNDDFKSFVEENEIEYCIVSRHSDYLRAVNEQQNVKNVYLWVHDVFPYGTPICNKNNFRKFIVLSNWQKMMIMKEYNVPENLMIVLDNALPPLSHSLSINSEKRPLSFIYSSSVERGLIYLLDIFPIIRKEFPDATLTVCCDTITPHGPADVKILKKLKEQRNNGVTIKGRLDREVLYEEMRKSEFFIYPSIFPETYCISALEAQAAGCICICTNLAALQTTVGDRGLLLDYNGLNNIEQFSSDIIKFIKKVCVDESFKNKIINAGKMYALEHTVEKMGERLIKILKG